jgi:DNA polymerase family B
MGSASIEIAGTFDIESASGWNRFALGVVYTGDDVHRHWWGSAHDLTPEEEGAEPPFVTEGRGGEDGGLDGMLDYMRARGGIYLSHGGGIYDSLAVLERARQRGISCAIDRASHRVTRVVMGRATFRDSYALWPVSLDEICGALRRKVPHLPWACTCGRKTCACGCGGCGGFCRIGEKAAQGDPDLLDYCVADCKGLYDGFHALRGFTTKHRINLRGTLASTAWKAAQDELGVPESDLPWHLWRAVRKADKGGRQCVVRPRAKGPGTHHDICNAYPAQLAKAQLPVGKIRELADADARGALRRERPGVYSLTVRVPDSLFIPPLPWSHAGRLYFPVGEVTGTWSLPELAAALERGCSIVKVHTAVIWQGTANIFESLVQRWYEIRRAAGRKTPFGQWVGRLAKALCGKFAERPERQRVLMHPESIKVCLRVGHCRNGCTGRCGAYEQLDLKGEIFGVPYQKLGGSSYPQWSSYLRAQTRVQWLEQAERYGEDLCFGNTDSLWTLGRKSPEPLGDGLGEWEYQHAWCDLDVRSASTYAFRELPSVEAFYVDRSGAIPRGEFHTLPGELVVRGIPWATEEDWKRGSGVIDRGVVTFQSAARGTRGLWARRVRKWTLPRGADAERGVWGDRLMSAAGYTVPMQVAEIREQVKLSQARLRKVAEDARGARLTKQRTVNKRKDTAGRCEGDDDDGV